ncbi:MAG: hypothetical protein ACTSU5_18160 [Promethearchaeota archaeon]
MSTNVPLVLGWVFTVTGLVALLLLIIHVEAGKGSRVNIPFAAGCIIVLSVFLGLGFQFLLVSNGI